MRVELRAIALAKRFYQDQGFAVDDVSKTRGHNGYDLIVSRDGHSIRVEVKGCSRQWQIPDLFSTEFDSARRLVADVLCVVYLVKRHHPRVCLIPREAILPEYVLPKSGFRLSSKFKKQSKLEPYVSRDWPGRRWAEIKAQLTDEPRGADLGPLRGDADLPQPRS